MCTSGHCISASSESWKLSSDPAAGFASGLAIGVWSMLLSVMLSEALKEGVEHDIGGGSALGSSEARAASACGGEPDHRGCGTKSCKPVQTNSNAS